MSYAKVAQAARERATAQSPSQLGSITAPPSVSSQAQDDAAPSVAVPTPATSTHPNDVDTAEPQKSAPAESYQSQQPMQRRDSEIASISAGESAASVGRPAETSSTVSRDEDLSASFLSDRAPGRSYVPAPGAGDDSAFKKARKGKKSRTSDGDGDVPATGMETMKEPPKVELLDAPAPTVNIWTMRQTQAAKVKQPIPAVPRSTISPAVPNYTAGSVSKPAEPNRVTGTGLGIQAPDTGTFGSIQNGTKGQRRPSEAARPSTEAPRRTAPRGSRVGDKDDVRTGQNALPVVNDASSWPTPKNSSAADDAKPKAAEQSDRPEKDNDESGRPKQKWVTMDFVPTAVFQTQFASRGGPKRGGARGGREGSTRGAHAGTAAGPPSFEKLSPVGASSSRAFGGDQDRNRESNSTAGPPSQGPTKRGSLDTAYGGEQRKPAPDRFGGTAASNSSASYHSSYGGERQSTWPRKSWKTEKPVNGQGTGKADYDPRTAREPVNGDGRYHTTRAGETPSKSPDFYKDGSYQAFRDQAQPGRRESGGGRGGRGGRGRGGGPNGIATHGHYTPALGVANGSMSATSAYPPQPSFYSPSQPYGFQNGGTYGVNGVHQRPSRSQTLGSSSYGGRGPNGMSSAEWAHPMQTPLDFYAPPFPAFNPVNPLEDPVKLQVVRTQVEYYFSEENLQRDSYLRKQMDSQGFVRLDIIAGFRRLQSLAEGVLEYIRTACEVSEELDFLLDIDSGTEFVRARRCWNEYVLPEDQRDEQARNPGPNLRNVRWRSQPSGVPQMFPDASVYPMASPVDYSANYGAPIHEQPQLLYPNVNGGPVEPLVNGSGINGHAYHHQVVPMSQLSAEVPDFSPGGSFGGPLALENYQNFADEAIPNVVVRIAEDGHTQLPDAGHGQQVPQSTNPNGTRYDSTPSDDRGAT